ncbi:unnamed protein product [Porites lobata]|uniref:Uncharacterized protein n=1 Tax=Porites lobata TaxID=104759 RepID=A0ABN8P3N8_9CNID|nr:unnamed protein product [Porites lobata]
MFCVQPFVVPVRSPQFKRVFDVTDAKIYARPLSVYYNYGRDTEILQIFFVENHFVVKIDRKMTPLFLVLLSLLAIGHATKSCFELSGANCYYKPEPCPAHLEDCSKKFTCSLSTNKCCCPKSGPPSVPPSGPTRPKLRSCFDSSGANCYYKPEPCPAHLEDCSKKFTCSLSTNKCCCPKSGPPSVPPSGPTPPPTPKPSLYYVRQFLQYIDLARRSTELHKFCFTNRFFRETSTR